MGQLSAPPIVGAAGESVAPLAGASFALFLDVDGTLIDLAARPDDVVTPPDLISTLKRAESTLGGALALISGRSIDDVDRIFAPLRLRMSGVHGAEIRFDPDAPTIATTMGDLPKSLLAALERAIRPFPGVFVEDKRFSFTVHYRLAPSAEQPLRRIVKQLIEFDIDRRRNHGCALRDRDQEPQFRQGRRDCGFSLHAHILRANTNIHR